MSDKDTRSEPHVLISSFIESRTDPETFSLEWAHLAPYLNHTQRLQATPVHLASNHPAGNAIAEDETGEESIHGAGVIPRPGGTELPCLEIGRTVHVRETLSHKRVGIRAVRGVGRTKHRQLREAGIETRDELAQAHPKQLLSLEGFGPYDATMLPTSARAHQNNEIAWFGSDPLQGRDRVYVDIETDSLRPTNIWQIGVYDETEDQYHDFLQTEDPEDARTVPRQFARWVHEHAAEKSFVSWYGSQFDYVWLSRFVERHAPPDHRESWERAEKVDLLTEVIKPNVCLPVRSHKLSVVSRRLGYERNQPGLEGADAARAYSRWLQGQEPDWDRWIEYCRDDVFSMYHIYQQLRGGRRHLDRQRMKQLYERLAPEDAPT